MAETYGKNIHIPQTTQDVFTNTYENSSVIIPKIDGLLDAIATYSPVLSVNSQTGNVLLSTSDIGEGTNLYYTDERAQDAVGGILSAEFTYDDVTPTISINSITYAKISGLGTIAVQNANNVSITGGAIDGTTIGATTPSTGGFSSILLTQSVADTKYIDVSGSFTNSSGTVTGIIDLSPNVDLSVAASHQIYRLVPVLRPSIDQTTVTVLNNNVQLGSSSNNFSTLINNQSQLNLTASYSGTVTTYRGYSVANPSIAGGALTNWYGFYTVAQSAAANACGVAIGALSSATKNTYVLLGTNTIPTGNWGIYNSSTNANYFAGNVGIGTSTVSDPLTVSGNVSAGSFNSQLFSAGGQSLSLIAGASSSVAGARSTAIGNAANTTATTTDGTAVGYAASAGLYGTSLGRSAGAAGTGGVAVGYGANTSTGAYNVAIGYGSQSTGGGGLAVGGNANANAATTIGIAFGRNATLTANAQMVVGANNLGITDCYFGSGVTDPAPASTTINATGGSGTDIAGASITIAGGKPTGAGAGGDIIFKTAQAGTTGTTLRSLTERVRITSTGNVGIGSSAPSTNLHVYGGASGATISSNVKLLVEDNKSNYIQMLAPNASTTGVIGGDAASASRHGLYFYGSTAASYANSVQLIANGATYLMLNGTTGSVGIGSASPNHTLDVNGNIGLAASSYINFGSTDGTTGYGLRDNSGTIEYKNSGGSWTGFGVATNFAAGSAGSPGFYVTGDSDTGLYEPAANTLSVTAGGIEAARFNTATTGVNYFSFTPSATGSAIQMAAAGTDTNVSIALMPKGSGGVGIGTTSATAPLEVLANSSANGIRIRSNTTPASYYLDIKQNDGTTTLQTTNSDLYLTAGGFRNFYTAGGGGWAVLHSFGVTNPMTYAAGSTTLNGAQTLFISAAGSWAPTSGTGAFTGLYLNPVINQTGTASGNYAGLQVNVTETAALGTASGNYTLWAGKNNAAQFVVQAGGNVGIGTTAPGTTLHVGSATLLNAHDGGGTLRNPDIYVGKATGVAMIGAGVTNSGHNRRAALFVDDTNGLWGLSAAYDSGAMPFVIRGGVAYGEQFRIDTSGNVGIGTTTTTYTLTVNGITGASSFVPTGSTVAANGLYLPTTNTPAISANSLDVMRFGVEASAVNYLLSTGRATGNGVSLVSQGSDTNINFVFGAKGSGAVRFATAATSGTAYTEQARVSHTASAVNYVNLTGAATGNGPVLSPAGSDTNISLNITPKGTGSVLINGPSTISGAATLSSTLNVTGAASFSSTGAFTGNLGVGGAASGTYNFNVSTASATQGYFGSTGANWCTVTIDATNTSQQSLVRFQEAATNKWLVGRSSANTFIVYDSADAKYFITATTASKLELGANQYLTITNANNVVVGTAALATSATNGFLYIPTCAGAPSGTPTAFTGRVPLVYDSTNNKLYAYNSAWKSATFT